MHGFGRFNRTNITGLVSENAFSFVSKHWIVRVYKSRFIFVWFSRRRELDAENCTVGYIVLHNDLSIDLFTIFTMKSPDLYLLFSGFVSDGKNLSNIFLFLNQECPDHDHWCTGVPFLSSIWSVTPRAESWEHISMHSPQDLISAGWERSISWIYILLQYVSNLFGSGTACNFCNCNRT